LTIRLNGEAHELAGPLSISALLTALGIDARRVAVEHNLVVVKRTAYDSTIIHAGDEVEVVNFVGGGSPDCGVRIAECGSGLPSADLLSGIADCGLWSCGVESRIVDGD
jgi:thiamine biosynthesis protein ThiS